MGLPDNDVVGRAALLSIDLVDPDAEGAMWSVFEETPGDSPERHPIAKAWALWESIKDDFPAHTASVVGNGRAHALSQAYRVSSLLGMDYETELREAMEALAAAESESVS